MTRVCLVLFVVGVTAGIAGAQAPPPPQAPQAAPAPQAPAAPQTPGTPQAAPAPVAPTAPAAATPMAVPAPATPGPWAVIAPVTPVAQVDAWSTVDRVSIADAVQSADWAASLADTVAAQAAREMADFDMQQAAMQLGMQQAPMQLGEPLGRGALGKSGPNSVDGNYNRGLSSLTQHQYENAITWFDRVIDAKAAHADGALYYKAWALSKLGRSGEAVTTLGTLRSSYPSSPYLTEAKTLEANVKKLGPDQVDDDDIKLLAISAIQYSDPTKAVATCESVLNGTNSLLVKKRAIYVLALLDQPEAHALLLSYAKGKGNPELQRDAIMYLGARNAKQPTKSSELIDIYNSTTDVDIRMAVISAFRSAGDKSSLMGIASGRGVGVGRGMAGNDTTTYVVTRGNGRGEAVTTDDLLRTRAINNLSDLASPQELWPLYQKEENKDLRMAWVSTFASMGATEQLTEIVKTEKDPGVRQHAIRSLGQQKSDKTSSLLIDLYNGGDKDTKTAVISALGEQSNADALVTIARKETDRDLKIAIVRQLVNLAPRSKVAADYLVEFIK